MGVLLQWFILSLFVKKHSFIKVFTTPKLDYNDELADAFSRYINVSTPVLTNISSCLWISLDFEEVKSRFTTTFLLKVEWTDARLTWYDLNEDTDLNIPSKEQKKIIWFPKRG